MNASTGLSFETYELTNLSSQSSRVSFQGATLLSNEGLLFSQISVAFKIVIRFSSKTHAQEAANRDTQCPAFSISVGNLVLMPLSLFGIRQSREPVP